MNWGQPPQEVRRAREGCRAVPEPGFSIGDLLHPKPRRYQLDFHERVRGRRPDAYIGRRAAVRLREQLGLVDVPVDLGPVCRFLAVSVIDVPQIPEKPNALARHVGPARIEIVRGLERKLYRVTLAHELGHEVLRHSSRSIWDTLESLYGRGDPHEDEAWDFAGELLMPYHILKQHRLKPLSELEAIFDVSGAAIAVQLSRRGLL